MNSIAFSPTRTIAGVSFRAAWVVGWEARNLRGGDARLWLRPSPQIPRFARNDTPGSFLLHRRPRRTPTHEQRVFRCYQPLPACHPEEHSDEGSPVAMMFGPFERIRATRDSFTSFRTGSSLPTRPPTPLGMTMPYVDPLIDGARAGPRLSMKQRSSLRTASKGSPLDHRPMINNQRPTASARNPLPEFLG